jgi:MacB-like periplasmic core domain
MEAYQRKERWRWTLIAFFCTILSVACSRSDSHHSKDFQFPVVVDISLGGQIHRVKGEVVTSRFFNKLDCRPYLGRVFRDDDHGSPVVVLSYRLWERLYGSNPSLFEQRLNLRVLGQPLTPYEVIGVTPPSFTGAELWILPFRVLVAPWGIGEQASGIIKFPSSWEA